MTTERELLARHLRELLEVVENPESDISQLRPWLRYWWFGPPTGEEISSRLSRIERRLSTLEPQRCALAEGESANRLAYLITGLDERRNEERRHITSWLAGTNKLTISDPYFFSFSGPNKVFRTQAQYVEWLIDFIPKKIEKLEVFHLPGPNRRIYSSIAEYCRKKGISLQNHETNEIHDRVLIKNDKDAKAIGTSFGGLGNKIAFVLDLPEEDLQAFRRELHRIRTAV